MSDRFNFIHTTQMDKLRQAKNEYEMIYEQMEQLENHMESCAERFIKSFMKLHIERHYEISEDIINIVLRQYPERFVENQVTDSEDDWMGNYRFNFGDLVLEETMNKRSFVVSENETDVWLWYFTEINSIIIESTKKSKAKFIRLCPCDIDDNVDSLSRII